MDSITWNMVQLLVHDMISFKDASEVCGKSVDELKKLVEEEKKRYAGVNL